MFGGSWSSSFPTRRKGITNKNQSLNCGSSVQTGKITTRSQDLNSCQGLNNIFSYRAGTVPRRNKKNAASALWSTLKNDFPFVYLRETEGLNESHYSSL